jgi:hypothetical protein
MYLQPFAYMQRYRSTGICSAGCIRRPSVAAGSLSNTVALLLHGLRQIENKKKGLAVMVARLRTPLPLVAEARSVENRLRVIGL